MKNEQKKPQQIYEITIKGQLDEGWQEWFDGLHLEATHEGNTILRGAIPDQAALHGILKKINNLGLILLSVVQKERMLTMTQQVQVRQEKVRSARSYQQKSALGSFLILIAAAAYYGVNVWPMREIALSGEAIPYGFIRLLVVSVAFLVVALTFFYIGLGIANSFKKDETEMDAQIAMKAQKMSNFVLSAGFVAIVALLFAGFPPFCMANFAIMSLFFAEIVKSAVKLFYTR